MIDSLTRTIEGILSEGELDDARSSTWERLLKHDLLHPFQHGLEAWSDGASLIGAASARAPGIPYAEQVLASYLSAQLGAPCEGHLVTISDPGASDLVWRDGTVSGRVRFVPHAALATHLWLEAEVAKGKRCLACVELRGVVAEAGENLADEPRDTLSLHAAPAPFRSDLASSFSPLSWLGALLRSVQIAALSESVLSLCLEHARTRTQFGLPIGRFQAVQQQLAGLGCEVAALQAAVTSAGRAVDELGLARLEQAAQLIAATKVQAGLTARSAAEVGHAVHAAIGFTREHRLHRYTLRLLSYRAEFGAERSFARYLGAWARSAGPDALWSQLVAFSRPA